MRHSILLITFTLTFAILKGQSLTKQDKEFILDFYREQNSSTKPFLYTKGINSYESIEIIRSLQRNDTLKNWRRVDNKLQLVDTLILSTKEKQFIINRLENQVDTSLWNGISIPNSLTILQDTIKAIFKDRKRGWNYFYSNYGRSFNSFTIPIFFRNNQLCAFYYDNICGGLCGEGVFALYRREKDHWVRWFTIYEWVS